MRGPLIYRADRGVLHFTTFRRENVCIFLFFFHFYFSFFQDAFEVDPCQGEARWLSMKIKFANKVYAGKKDGADSEIFRHDFGK